MVVLKILILFLLLSLGQRVRCQTGNYYYDFTEDNSREPHRHSKKVNADNKLTHVRTKNLSGNVKLTTLQVLTTNAPFDKSNSVLENEKEDVLDRTTEATLSKNKQNLANATIEDQQKAAALSDFSTKDPTDGTEPLDVFNGASGTLPATEKLITVMPLNFELIRDEDSIKTAVERLVTEKTNTENESSHREIEKQDAAKLGPSENVKERKGPEEVRNSKFGAARPMVSDNGARSLPAPELGFSTKSVIATPNGVSGSLHSFSSDTTTTQETKGNSLNAMSTFEPKTKHKPDSFPTESTDSRFDEVFMTLSASDEIFNNDHASQARNNVVIEDTAFNSKPDLFTNFDDSITENSEPVEDLSSFINLDEEILHGDSDASDDNNLSSELIDDIASILYQNENSDVVLDNDVFRQKSLTQKYAEQETTASYEDATLDVFDATVTSEMVSDSASSVADTGTVTENYLFESFTNFDTSLTSKSFNGTNGQFGTVNVTAISTTTEKYNSNSLVTTIPTIFTSALNKDQFSTFYITTNIGTNETLDTTTSIVELSNTSDTTQQMLDKTASTYFITEESLIDQQTISELVETSTFTSVKTDSNTVDSISDKDIFGSLIAKESTTVSGYTTTDTIFINLTKNILDNTDSTIDSTSIATQIPAVNDATVDFSADKSGSAKTFFSEFYTTTVAEASAPTFYTLIDGITIPVAAFPISRITTNDTTTSSDVMTDSTFAETSVDSNRSNKIFDNVNDNTLDNVNVDYSSTESFNKNESRERFYKESEMVNFNKNVFRKGLIENGHKHSNKNTKELEENTHNLNQTDKNTLKNLLNTSLVAVYRNSTLKEKETNVKISSIPEILPLYLISSEEEVTHVKIKEINRKLMHLTIRITDKEKSSYIPSSAVVKKLHNAVNITWQSPIDQVNNSLQILHMGSSIEFRVVRGNRTYVQKILLNSKMIDENRNLTVNFREGISVHMSNSAILNTIKQDHSKTARQASAAVVEITAGCFGAAVVVTVFVCWMVKKFRNGKRNYDTSDVV